MGNFRTHHYEDYKPRNAMEQMAVAWCTANMNGEREGTLDEFRQVLAIIVQDWRVLDHIRGRIIISEVKVTGTWAGGGVSDRSFTVTAPGRRIPTITISESYPPPPRAARPSATSVPSVERTSEPASGQPELF